jgi:hypothetical protein
MGFRERQEAQERTSGGGQGPQTKPGQRRAPARSRRHMPPGGWSQKHAKRPPITSGAVQHVSVLHWARGTPLMVHA